RLVPQTTAPVGAGRVDQLAVDPVRGQHDEGDRVDRRHRTGRQKAALSALLPTGLDERSHVLEGAELGLVDAAPTARGQRSTDLRYHDADLVSVDLNHRPSLHRGGEEVEEVQAGHQQIGLVAGLAIERDDTGLEFATAPPTLDQARFERLDPNDRL